jgi:tetratricopeptide (TPR) repeat protein
MQGVGSITVYLRFVDKTTRETVLDFVDKSFNYTDFVRRVCVRVLEKDSDPLLVYLAVQYAHDLQSVQFLEKLARKYDGLHPVAPWLTLVMSALGHVVDVGTIARQAEDVLLLEPEPWIAFQMHGLIYDASRTLSHGSVEEERSLDAMEALLRDFEELAPLEPQLLWRRAEVLRSHGFLDEAIEMHNRAIELLAEQNHLIFLEKFHISAAYFIRHQEPGKALHHLDRAREIREQLGIIPVDCYNLLNIRGMVHLATGEFNAAAEYYLRAMELRETTHVFLSMRYLPANLASVLNRMGRYTEALEYAKMGLESRPFGTDHSYYSPFCHVQVSRALVGLGRTDEALEHLDTAARLSLKTGSDHITAMIHYIRGLIERAEGNLVSAMQTMEEAWRISESSTLGLLELVRTELMLYSTEDSSGDDDCSGVWMERFEERLSRADKPGYLGLSLLFKATLRFKQERNAEAEELLNEVREMAKSPKIQFLNRLLLQLPFSTS